jgi:hypothetical protein
MLSLIMIKISDTTAVNTKHVIAVIFDKTSLQTKLVFMGGASVVSDKSFQETIDILNLEEDFRK